MTPCSFQIKNLKVYDGALAPWRKGSPRILRLSKLSRNTINLVRIRVEKTCLKTSSRFSGAGYRQGRDQVSR